jgi:hypothetical protein
MLGCTRMAAQEAGQQTRDECLAWMPPRRAMPQGSAPHGGGPRALAAAQEMRKPRCGDSAACGTAGACMRTQAAALGAIQWPGREARAAQSTKRRQRAAQSGAHRRQACHDEAAAPERAALHAQPARPALTICDGCARQGELRTRRLWGFASCGGIPGA